jgi:hypothetical protein
MIKEGFLANIEAVESAKGEFSSYAEAIENARGEFYCT